MTPTPLPDLDLERYLGTWFEIGRLPMKYEDNATDVTATYRLEDGEIVVDNRSRDENNEPVQALGRAKVGEGPAQLKVSFLPEGLRWIPFTEADYWVLQIDPDYQHALVGTPDHKFLWLLARTPTMEVDVQEEYLAHARDEGYDLADWIRTAQSGNHVTDEMLEG